MNGRCRLVIASASSSDGGWRVASSEAARRFLAGKELRISVTVDEIYSGIESKIILEPYITRCVDYRNHLLRPHTHFLSPMSLEDLLLLIDAPFVSRLIAGPIDPKATSENCNPTVSELVRSIVILPAYGNQSMELEEWGLHMGRHRCEGQSADGTEEWHIDTHLSLQIWFRGIPRAYYTARDLILESQWYFAVAETIGPGVEHTTSELLQEI